MVMVGLRLAGNITRRTVLRMLYSLDHFLSGLSFATIATIHRASTLTICFRVRRRTIRMTQCGSEDLLTERPTTTKRKPIAHAGMPMTRRTRWLPLMDEGYVSLARMLTQGPHIGAI